MTRQHDHRCVGCDDPIEGSDVRYVVREDDETAAYCSLNCLADESTFDEPRVQERLFGETVAPAN